jgi:hypothetical protein
MALHELQDAALNVHNENMEEQESESKEGSVVIDKGNIGKTYD